MNPERSDSPGEIAARIAADLRQPVHVVLRGSDPTGRRSLARKLVAQGWSHDRIDRFWGFAPGTAAGLLRKPPLRLVAPPKLPPAPPAPDVVHRDLKPENVLLKSAPTVPPEENTPPAAQPPPPAPAPDHPWTWEDFLEARPRRFGKADSAILREARRQAREDHARAKAEERVRKAAERKAKLDARRLEDAQWEADRARRRSAQKAEQEASRKALEEEERRKREATAKQVEMAVRAQARQALHRPRVSVMPRCPFDRVGKGEPCGRLAIAWAADGSHACVYCAIKSRGMTEEKHTP